MRVQSSLVLALLVLDMGGLAYRHPDQPNAPAATPLPDREIEVQAGGAKASPWAPPLTDGQPDLQGVWTDTSITPLERPKVFGERAWLTDEEVRRYKANWERIRNDSTNDFLGGDTAFLALVAGVESVRNPNATGSVENMGERDFDNRTSLITDPPDGRLPPRTEEGEQRWSAGQAATLAIPWQPGQDQATQERRASEAAQRTPPAGPRDLSNTLRCITWGVPKLGLNPNYASHYEIIQSPGYVILISEVNHETRIIPLDGRPHLAPGLRQWNGDSRGHWQGRTLVIDTTNFSPQSYFMGAAANLHLTERFTRTAPDTMKYEITVDDRTTWTTPWTAVVHLKRTDEMIYEFACHEGNDHVVRGILAGARAEDVRRQAMKEQQGHP